ncbi:MAG: hypothetical protein AB1546_06440 [bacterium]
MKTAQHILLATFLLVSAGIGAIVGSNLFTAERAAAQDETTSLTATLYQVVDKDGNIKIQIGTGDDGQPLLALFDDSGQRREVMSITSSGEEPIMVLIDNNSSPRMVFGVLKKEGAQMGMYNEDKETTWLKP